MELDFLQFAKPLLRAPTAPFHEHLAFGIAHAFAAARPPIQVLHDRCGNSLLLYDGGSQQEEDEFIVLTAHLDHPGLVWKASQGSGRSLFEILGGVELEKALATGVRLFDLNRPATQRGVPGTIVRTVEAAGTRYPLLEVAAARDILQGPGTFAMWDLPAFRVRGQRLSGRAIDDLAGAAVALCVLDSLVRQQAPVRLGVLLTRAEEVGFVGMLAALEAGFLPRRARYINIECSSVAAGAVLGAGPILRVGDRLWVFDPDISSGMAALADELATQQPPFRYQRKLMDSGACEATPLMQADYRTGAVALPLGNYHNAGPGAQLAPEYIHLDDANGLVRLLVHVAQRGIGTGLAHSAVALDSMLASRLAHYRDRLLPL
jgi:endoglucanase